jgi:hypothetical protein
MKKRGGKEKKETKEKNKNKILIKRISLSSHFVDF